MKFQLFFTRKFTFQGAASASSFHAGPCFSADWGEMTCDVNSRTHASVSYTVNTIIPVFYNTVFLAMIIQRKMFATNVWTSTTTINIAQYVLKFT